MEPRHAWNHHNFSVPPERLPLIEACIDALFPWVKFVARPGLLGYRLQDDLHAGALYFRPTAAARAVEEAVAAHVAVSAAIAGLDGIDADWNDHFGFLVPTLAEWEERVAVAERLACERPEFRIRVVDVLRPGDGRALTDYLHQAFIRVGLLGPLRNTFEMQAVRRA
jgi:hypothetical protein